MLKLIDDNYLTMRDSMLPTTRHVKELIMHAEEHMNSGTEWDLKVSLIHADNSIEIMLKEYLRYRKEKSWGEIERMNFYKLLNSCKDINLVSNSKSFFLAYHDIRNAVYHTGTLVPMKEDVKSVVGFAKTLFNELHPQFKFVDVRIKLPSKRAINTVSSVLGFQPHMTEMLLMKEFSNYLLKSGYKVLIEPVMPDKSRADLLAQRENKLIVCEFKVRQTGMVVGREAVYFLKAQVEALRKKYPEKNVEGWLITNARFSKSTREVAKGHNIQLFDRQRLRKLLRQQK